MIKQVKDLLVSINTDSLSKKELLDLSKLPCKSRGTLEREYIKPAIEQGYVTMLYPKNPRHPKQKYMLTEKGIIVLKSLKEKK